MPPASLPLDPASPDEEVVHQGESVEIDIERPEPKPSSAARRSLRVSRESKAGASEAPAPAIERRASPSLSSSEAGAGDFSAQARLSMHAYGFGGQLKLVQYPRAWLGTSETFRYFKNEDPNRGFLNRRGVLVGLELNPWRNAFIAPFIDTQVGWELFEREGEQNNAQSIVMEAVAGAELRLTHFASLIVQWSEAYYPGLKDQLFFPEQTNKDPSRHASAEVLFNLKWETKLF